MKPVVVSGFKPSGELHIGNYLGALKQAVELQNSGKYNCYYFIADYHALTQHYNPKDKAKEIYMMAVDALAAGIDPKKSVFFMQSYVPEHANLTWIFNTITPTGRLENMIEYKEKLAQGESANAGLLDYPVLQAADILLYKAEFVPVGEDQRQHVELPRDVARAFNRRFGQTFKEPKVLLTKVSRLMSLDNPTKKMSKSLPAGCLYLMDSPETIRQKIKRAVTDSETSVAYNPAKRPAVSNLVLIYSEFSNETPTAVVKKFKGASYSEFKSTLADLLIEKLKPLRERRAKFAKNRRGVMKILEEGSARASEVSKKTFHEVRKKAGLI